MTLGWQDCRCEVLAASLRSHRSGIAVDIRSHLRQATANVRVVKNRKVAGLCCVNDGLVYVL